MTQVHRELLYGKQAHATPLVCIDVPPDRAGWRPEWSHSIWQLVWHMNFWMDHELKRIEGLPVIYPEHAGLSWPDTAPQSATQWQQEVAHFGELLKRFDGYAGESREQLSRPVAATHSSEAEHGSSLEAVLLQTIVHNSYHIGQVVMLRRALGLWPPGSGSDTW